MIETEYKFLLDKATFNRIKDNVCGLYNNSSTLLQTNYYYDDEQYSLNKNNITLRVRQIGETLKLQKKQHNIETNMPVVSDETEKVITALPHVIDDKYFLKGSLVTQRCRVSTNSSVHIDLDINYYLGICDYEVEIEINNSSNYQAETLIAELGLANIINIQGKSSRFFQRLKNLYNLK